MVEVLTAPVEYIAAVAPALEMIQKYENGAFPPVTETVRGGIAKVPVPISGILISPAGIVLLKTGKVWLLTIAPFNSN